MGIWNWTAALTRPLVEPVNNALIEGASRNAWESLAQIHQRNEAVKEALDAQDEEPPLPPRDPLPQLPSQSTSAEPVPVPLP